MRVVLILDASGSMVPKRSDVIPGFNDFVDALAQDEAKGAVSYLVTCVTFNTVVTPLVTNACVRDVPRLDEKNYQPGGNTALLDAVGTTLDEIGIPPNEKFLVLVVTDGEENSSRQFRQAQIKAMIEQRQATGWWTFSYLGADVDAFAEAGSLGIPPGNIANYDRHQTAGILRATAMAAVAYANQASTANTTFVVDNQLDKKPDE